MSFCPYCGAKKLGNEEKCLRCGKRLPALFDQDTAPAPEAPETMGEAQQPAEAQSSASLFEAYGVDKQAAQEAAKEKLDPTVPGARPTITHAFEKSGLFEAAQAKRAAELAAQQKAPAPTRTEAFRLEKSLQDMLDSAVAKPAQRSAQRPAAPQPRSLFEDDVPLAGETATQPGATTQDEAPQNLFEQPVAQPVQPTQNPKDKADALQNATFSASPTPAGRGPQKQAYTAKPAGDTTLEKRVPPIHEARLPDSAKAGKHNFELAKEQDPNKWQRLKSSNIAGLQDEVNKPGLPNVPLPSYQEGDPARGGSKKNRKKRRGKGSVVLLVAILLVLALLGGTAGLLVYQNSAKKAVNSFVSSAQSGSVAGLRDNTRISFATGNEGWGAFAAAFGTEAAVEDLRLEMNRRIGGTTLATDKYTSIQIESEPYLLFINRYYIRVNPVEILVKGAQDGAALYLEGVAVQGTQTGEGMLYRGIMPGRYHWQVEGVDENGQPATRSGESTFMLAGDEGNVVDLYSNTADVSVENCISDKPTIYVNGASISTKPQGGTLALPELPFGSVIRIEATDEEGNPVEASVVFSDISVTTLRFGNYTMADGTPVSTGGPDSSVTGIDPEADPAGFAAAATTEDINSALVRYYQSYLNAINNQAPDSVEAATATFVGSLREAITGTANAANTFEYQSAACDAESISVQENGNIPTIVVNASFEYRYTPRTGGATQDGFNYRTIQLVYQNGEWMLNNMANLSEAQYAAHTHAGF